MSTITFDAFEYAHQLREAGITEQQAEIIAKKTNEIIVAVARDEVRFSDLSTKRDLKELELQVMLQIEKSKNATLLWMFAMLTGVVGIMAKGFHWF